MVFERSISKGLVITGFYGLPKFAGSTFDSFLFDSAILSTWQPFLVLVVGSLGSAGKYSRAWSGIFCHHHKFQWRGFTAAGNPGRERQSGHRYHSIQSPWAKLHDNTSSPFARPDRSR